MVKRRFDYEKNYANVKNKLDELKDLSKTMNFDLKSEIDLVEEKMEKLRENKYKNLTPWEKVLLSRHPERPAAIDFINHISDEWIEMHGDRKFADDPAIIGGIARLAGQPVTIIGQQKGKQPKENMRRNYGMPHPEGYRKVQRLLLQAEKFRRPVITFINTPGAYPGIGAEERGQALAIAESLTLLSEIRVPVIAVVTGEGGSGGALAIAVSDRLIMLSNSIFSVASVEACTSILCKDGEQDIEAMSEVMKLTAQDLYELDIVDEIIEEPVGGAHLNFDIVADNLKECLIRNLEQLTKKDIDELVAERYKKIRNIGRYIE